jgi:uncharacterized protein (DUF1800 family)
MGDATTPLTAAEARHLLRRTGFGAQRALVDALAGRARGAAADELLAFNPSGFAPKAPYFETAHDKWVKYIAKKTGKPSIKSARVGLQEKLVIFWHDHFATSVSVVSAKLLADQNKLFRRMCKGSFKALVKAVNKDPAMMSFLNTVDNHKDVPNENYARELQELFTLGVKDLAGNDTYTQADIVQVARAFTGWHHDDKPNSAHLHDYDHDYAVHFPERGPKVIYQSTGGFGPAGRDFTVNGEGEAEIDTVVDIIFEHTDSDGRSTVARHLAWKLIQYFAHPAPSTAFVDEVVGASGFAATWDLSALLRAILVDDDFYAGAAPAPYGPAAKRSVKWPIDFVVGTLNQLGMKTKGRDLRVQGGSYATLRESLIGMGQGLLDPPSVFGWDWETSWISSAALLARYDFARNLASARSGGALGLRPERLVDLDLTDPGDIVDAVAGALGVTDQLVPADRAAHVAYLTDGGLNPTLNLNDYYVRNTKLHGLFALVLESPAYQMH